jgi:DNA-binding protein HU-beta
MDAKGGQGHGHIYRASMRGKSCCRQRYAIGSDELTALSEKELKRSGEFVLPGMVKLVVQKRKARMGRNPATGEAIKIPAKTVVKARIAKQLKDAVLPKK